MPKRKNRQFKLKDPIYIVGEGITEQYYFKHLKPLGNFNYVMKPRFFSKTSINQIEKTVDKLLSGGVTVICVFDADVKNESEKISKSFDAFYRKYQKNVSVLICDSMPSIEFWFLLHFIKTNKHFNNSKALEKELKTYISSYQKTEKYLAKTIWVEPLFKNLRTAINNAKAIDSLEGSPTYTNVYKAFEKLLVN